MNSTESLTEDLRKSGSCLRGFSPAARGPLMVKTRGRRSDARIAATIEGRSPLEASESVVVGLKTKSHRWKKNNISSLEARTYLWSPKSRRCRREIPRLLQHFVDTENGPTFAERKVPRLPNFVLIFCCEAPCYNLSLTECTTHRERQTTILDEQYIQNG